MIKSKILEEVLEAVKTVDRGTSKTEVIIETLKNKDITIKVYRELNYRITILVRHKKFKIISENQLDRYMWSPWEIKGILQEVADFKPFGILEGE